MGSRSFRQGEEGYVGCEDRSIKHPDFGASPPGDDPYLYFRNSDLNRDYILIRFEDLPTDANLQATTAAILKVFMWRANPANPLVTAEIYEVLRDWDEADATWDRYSEGNNWTTPGCDGVGTDRNDVDLLESWTPRDALGWQEFAFNAAGVAVVKSWLGGGANNGLLLKAIRVDPGMSGCRFDSSEGWYTFRRPALVFSWPIGRWWCKKVNGILYGKQADFVGVAEPPAPSWCWQGSDGIAYGIHHNAAAPGTLPQWPWESPTGTLRQFEMAQALDPAP